jgi:hypothetical protein
VLPETKIQERNRNTGKKQKYRKETTKIQERNNKNTGKKQKYRKS